MIWFFDRDGQRLQYEVRRTATEEGYELVVTYPEGRVEAEQLDEPSELLRSCVERARALREEGWRSA